MISGLIIVYKKVERLFLFHFFIMIFQAFTLYFYFFRLTLSFIVFNFSFSCILDDSIVSDILNITSSSWVHQTIIEHSNHSGTYASSLVCDQPYGTFSTRRSGLTTHISIVVKSRLLIYKCLIIVHEIKAIKTFFH